jgi:hypothetical protein
MKRLTQNQITGQIGEKRVEERTLSMGFVFDGKNRLETGIDGTIELRNPVTGQTLAKWIGVQVKTTAGAEYLRETEQGFEYLLNGDDLAYWRTANIPVVIVLVRLSDSSMYWKQVDAQGGQEPRRLRIDKTSDCFDLNAADRIASLCIEKDRFGSYIPPMQTDDPVHLTMVQVTVPDDVFVGPSPFASGKEAAKALVAEDPHARFDWVVRGRTFFSFRDPSDTSLCEIVDEGAVEAVDPDDLDYDEPDTLNSMLELLGRTLSVQLEKDLSFDKESRALFFRARAANQPRSYHYKSLVNDASADVVRVWKDKKGQVGSVRHHAFVPRFHRIGSEWLLSVAPTYVFTRDGFRPHLNASALIAGKKKLDKEGAVRGQFLMWRHLLIASGEPTGDLLADEVRVPPLLKFSELPSLQMPIAVPEAAWAREDPNAPSMSEGEGFL